MNTPTQDQDALVCAAVYLLQALGDCYRCHAKTRLFAVMALPPFTLEGEQDEPQDENGSVLSELADVPATLEALLKPIVGSLYREDFSATANTSYWMNHCEQCDAKQGDHFVQGPNGPFWPEDEIAMQAIEAVRINGPFRLPDAGTTYSGAIAAWRDRRHGIAPVVKPKRKPRQARTKRASGS